MQAVNCATCGAKVRTGAKRCPRCRALFVAPDPVAAAAASRVMLKVAAGIGAAFLILIGVLWLRSEAPIPETAVAPSTARPSAAQVQSRPAAAPAVAAPVERPFMEPAAAASVSYGAGDYDAALALYLAAVEKNPNDAESLSNLGQVLVRLNRAEEALPYFERAVALIPGRWAYRFNLARAHGVLGRWEQAVEGYRTAQSIFPDDYATAFNLGMALHKQGNEVAAVEAYQKAIGLEPNDPSFRMALAISYERLKKPAEAAAAYGEALRLQPDAPDADRVRARIAQLTG